MLQQAEQEPLFYKSKLQMLRWQKGVRKGPSGRLRQLKTANCPGPSDGLNVLCVCLYVLLEYEGKVWAIMDLHVAIIPCPTTTCMQ